MEEGEELAVNEGDNEEDGDGEEVVEIAHGHLIDLFVRGGVGLEAAGDVGEVQGISCCESVVEGLPEVAVEVEVYVC